MIDVGSITAVVGTLCAVLSLEEVVRRQLNKAHQTDITNAVDKERERLAEVQKRIDAERIAAEQAHELADAIQRIAELERSRPVHHRRADDGSNDRPA